MKMTLKPISVFLVATAAMFASCGTDESYDVTGATANTVYINESFPGLYPNNSFVYQIKHTPESSTGPEISIGFPARITRLTDSNVNVTAVLDNSLITAFNEAYGTEYIALPSGILSVENLAVTIPANAYASADSIKVSIDAEKYSLLKGNSYVAPIAISDVSDSSMNISSNLGTAYVVINCMSTNIRVGGAAATIPGTLNSTTTGWDATASPSSTSGAMANIFTTSTSTYWGFGSQSVTITVDMAEVKSLAGFRLYQRGGTNTSRRFTKVAVSVSADGDSYESQGPALAQADMAYDSGYQYVSFYEAVQARYVKLELTFGGTSSSYWALVNFGAYFGS